MPGWISGRSAIESDGVIAITEGVTFGQSHYDHNNGFALITLAQEPARQPSGDKMLPLAKPRLTTSLRCHEINSCRSCSLQHWSKVGLEAALRRRSGSSSNRSPKAGIPETPRRTPFQQCSPVSGHLAAGSGRLPIMDGTTALSPQRWFDASSRMPASLDINAIDYSAAWIGVLFAA